MDCNKQSRDTKNMTKGYKINS